MEEAALAALDLEDALGAADMEDGGGKRGQEGGGGHSPIVGARTRCRRRVH